MTTDAHEHLSARVTGRVQGVGFRHFVRTTARDLGVTGWVRNEPDGSVCVEAEGPREDLDALFDALHEGPISARIEEVEADWDEAQGDFDGFTVRY